VPALLAFDSETWLIQPGRAVPRPVVFSFAAVGTAPWLLLPDAGVRRLEAALDGHEILIGHNVAFDLAVAAEYYPPLLKKVFAALRAGRIRDSKIRQILLDIAEGRRKNPSTKKREVWRDGQWVAPDYSLAGSPKIKGSTGLVGLHLGKDRSADKGEDAWRLRYAELEGMPLEVWPEEAARYARDDATDTLEVYLAQARKAGVGDLDPLVDEVPQVRAAFALRLVSAWGLRTNKDTLDKLEVACNRVAREVRERLIEKGLFRYQGPKKEPRRKIVKDTKEVQRRVLAAFEGSGLPVPKTAKGAVKTDRDTLVLSCDPDLVDLAEAGPADTVRRMFIPAFRGGVKHPINTSFTELLETGRISSSEPNLNNAPRGDVLMKLIGQDVRSAVEPRPGFWLCSVDFDSAELRSHAQVCYWLFGESAMGDLFKRDPKADPYLDYVAGELGISYEEAKARKPDLKAKRQGAKPILLSLPGGLGPHKFVEIARKQYGVKVTVPEARLGKEKWKRRYPEMRKYLDYMSQLTQSGSATITQFVSGRKRGRVGYCDGANTYFQGLTADGFKEALSNAVEEAYTDCGTALYGSRPVGAFYDEILAEVPIDIAHEAAFRLRDVMVEAMRKYVPDVPITAEPALMTKWMKAAEPKYVDGRLVPWDLT
jgi:DNA polymerase I